MLCAGGKVVVMKIGNQYIVHHSMSQTMHGTTNCPVSCRVVISEYKIL